MIDVRRQDGSACSLPHLKSASKHLPINYFKTL